METAFQWAMHLASLSSDPYKIPIGVGAEATTQEIPRNLILHSDALVTGMVIAVYGPGGYISPANDKPVQSCVIELDGGHTFTFNGAGTVQEFQQVFYNLSQREAQFLVNMMGTMDAFIKGAAGLGAAMKLDFTMGRRLLCAVLERSLRALKTPIAPKTPG